MAGANDSSPSASTPSLTDNAAPPLLAAVFLIEFDLKVGYTITWKRSITDVELDGAVEFKSLPSGLHTVTDDLVYFIHGQYAGLSAFVNGPASEAQRNAHLVAAGVLVPLSYGRLGRSWLHAQTLRDLASALVDDTTKTEPLEKFWEQYRQDRDKGQEGNGHRNGSSQPGAGYKTHNRSRALSSLTNVLPSDQQLPTFHPALSILQYIDTLGPLIFPLHRAALLRKRILFITPPPVRLSCEYVFDLSILSSIPVSIAELFTPDTEPLHRLRPFFAIGIHDIPMLEKEAALAKAATAEPSEPEVPEISGSQYGWVACTTDEILATKPKLYDILVELPATSENAPNQKKWAKIKTNAGTEIKATQRDLRRWRILQRELHKVWHEPYQQYHDDNSDEEDDDGAALLRNRSASSSLDSLSPEEAEYDDKAIESISWSQLAYNGFMWWASAGERDVSVSEEADRDRQVLGDLSDYVPLSPRASRPNGLDLRAASVDAGIHTAIIAYFHRLTSVLVSTLAEIVESTDDEEEPDEDSNHQGEERGVFVGSDEITRMGLDAWSEADGGFARGMLRMYFGRDAFVRGAGIECCGLRIY